MASQPPRSTNRSNGLTTHFSVLSSGLVLPTTFSLRPEPTPRFRLLQLPVRCFDYRLQHQRSRGKRCISQRTTDCQRIEEEQQPYLVAMTIALTVKIPHRRPPSYPESAIHRKDMPAGHQWYKSYLFVARFTVDASCYLALYHQWKLHSITNQQYLGPWGGIADVSMH